MRRLSTRAAGLLILILGIWGGLVPFVGPYFHFALGPNHSWTWTSGRFWLSVLPGIVAIIGGLMLLGAGPRPSGKLGALLALAAGIWFAIGPDVSLLWNTAGAVGVAHGSRFIRTLELLTYHTLLGTVIAALAGYALPGLVTRRAAAEAEAEAELAPVGSETAALHDRDGRVPAGVTPRRGRITAQREPVMADREAVADERERDAVAAGHEPVATGGERLVAEHEPGAMAADRGPVAAGREPVGAGREPVGAGREPGVVADGREPVTADRGPAEAPTGPAPARDASAPLTSGSAPLTPGRAGREDSRAQTAVLDRPVQSGQQATPEATAAGGGPATADVPGDSGSAAPVTMRRRRGGLLSRLRG